MNNVSISYVFRLKEKVIISCALQCEKKWISEKREKNDENTANY